MSYPLLRRIDDSDFENINAAAADGYDFIGTLHTYELQIDLSDDIRIVEADRGFLNGILEVARESFSHSRFYADPNIPVEVAWQTYEHRIRFGFKASATYFVAMHRDEVVGFCALQNNEVTLIAVTKAYQQKGIGRELIEACVNRCWRNGSNVMQVKTQGSNRVARSFYEKQGFKRNKIEKDFHKHG